MGFFKNINTDIKEIPAFAKVNVGDAGKMTYTRKLLLNYKTTTHESPLIKLDEIITMCTRLNVIPRFEGNGIYIQKSQKTEENNEDSLPYYTYLNSEDTYIPYGQVTYKTTYDSREDKYERFYKVEKVLNHPDASHLKTPSAIIRHACTDCAFYGRCQSAPECNTRYIKEICNNNDQRLIKNAMYFKYYRKADKLIDSTITPQESYRTNYVSKDEWAKSLPVDQHDNH